MGFKSCLLSFASLSVLICGATAQERHYRALVIGNSRYPGKPLTWAAADARAVAARLSEVGYEVSRANDTGTRQLLQALANWRQSIGSGDVALLYYAGRATRAYNISSLVPIDDTNPDRNLGLRVSNLLDALAETRAAGIAVVLDVAAEWPIFGLDISAEWLRSIPPPSRRTVVASSAGAHAAPGAAAGTVTAKLLRALAHPERSLADLARELGAPSGAISELAQIPRAPGAQAQASRQPPAATVEPAAPPSRAAGAPPGPSSGPTIPPPIPVATPPRPDQVPLQAEPDATDNPEQVPALTRFPTIEAPDRIAAGVPFAVLVSLTIEKRTSSVAVMQVGPGVGQTPEGALQVSLPCQITCELEVVLAAPGFEFTSGSNTAIILMQSNSDSTPARFNLKALQPGDAKIEASFWSKGAFLARAVRTIQVSGGAPVPGARTAITAQSVSSATPRSPATASLLPLGAAPPDLTVRWEESTVGTQQYCIVIVTSPYLGTVRSAPCVPGADLGKYMAQRYQQLQQAGSRGVTLATGRAGQAAGLSADQARGIGRELYDHFATKPFQDAFWALVDKERSDPGFHFRTIQIYTNDPVLPWELLVPARPDGSGARSFLGLEFDVARWHIGDRVDDLPPVTLPLDQVVAFAPHYQGGKFLAHQKEELDAMRAVHGYHQSAGSAAELLKVLDDPPAGIIHFAGHGFARPDPSGVSEYGLQFEDAVLNPTIWRGHRKTGAKNHPLVVLNACETGGEQNVAGFIDGWAAALLESGASGFIGGLWPLGDKGAAEFAREFYEGLQKDLTGGGKAPVAELVRQARTQFTRTGDPTFLAYVFYGDARLRIK